jgi:hypothetical protein
MLVDSDDLATYMDIGRFNNRQEDNANLIIAGVQSEIETFLRRPIELSQLVEEYRIPEDYLHVSASAYFYDLTTDTSVLPIERAVQPPYVLHLNNSPVASVSLVRRKGLNEASYTTMIAGQQYSVSGYGIDLFNVVSFDRIEVTYTAGLDGDAIPYLKLLVLRVASREMQNLTDDVVGLKDLTTREVAIRDVGLTDGDKATLKRWRRRQI